MTHIEEMACPACRVALVMSDRQGIEIDYCPKCRGIWLDRGELDKIIERSQTASSGPANAPVAHQRQDGNYHGKRRKSFLQELFD